MKEKNILIRSFIRNPDKTRATRNRIAVFQTGAVWFALSLSFSALTAGTAAAPLGASAGAAALIIGQLTGGFLLYLAGRNGEKNGKKSMESSVPSFGQAGSSFFAVLNLIQLAGWPAFLIRESSDLISEMIPGMSDSVLPAAAGHIFRIALTGGLILLLLAGAADKLFLICIPAALTMIVLLILLCLQITENSGSFSFSGYRAAFGDVVALSASLPSVLDSCHRRRYLILFRRKRRDPGPDIRLLTRSRRGICLHRRQLRRRSHRNVRRPPFSGYSRNLRRLRLYRSGRSADSGSCCPVRPFLPSGGRSEFRLYL